VSAAPQPRASALRPYADTALDYLEAGWEAPIPLGGPKQRKRKSPPPGGEEGTFTGYDAAVPSVEQIERWRRSHGVNNIGLVLPPDIVGIDVDDYEKAGKRKHGGDQLTALAEQLGPLPAAPRSTARGSEGLSGIRFYRLPTDLVMDVLNGVVRLKSKLAPDIELIRHGHRYAAAWPSVNPENGEFYEWYTTDGSVLGRPPRVAGLKELPPAWAAFVVEGYDDGRGETGHGLSGVQRAELDDDAVRAWLKRYGPTLAL